MRAHDLPSARALWAIFWRAVLFFPLGVVLVFVPFLFPFGIVYLGISAYLFWLREEWLLMFACLATLPVTFLLWRVFARWYFSAADQNRQLDGHSRV